MLRVIVRRLQAVGNGTDVGDQAQIQLLDQVFLDEAFYHVVTWNDDVILVTADDGCIHFLIGVECLVVNSNIVFLFKCFNVGFINVFSPVEDIQFV